MEKSESRRHRIGGATSTVGVSKNQMAGLYDLEETIGEGHYAVVKLAKHVFTGEKVAVKVIDKLKLDAATRLQMMQEVRLMKLVQHPYVVRLYEVIDTQTKLYLVLEFADGGDMYDYIMKHEGGLEESMAKKYFRQIVTAIQYCHKLHVVHRDLKPENVVFFEKLGMVKLTDFGFSNKFDPGQRLQTSCGSLAYSAPEILLGDSYDAPAVDIWSLGVILYMLVCGTAPFQEANDSETLTMIMDCKYSFPSHISQKCKSLISRMLQREPEVRASLEDIVNDTWLIEDTDGEGSISEFEIFPLVAREHLTEEEHSSVLQKMVNGSIAHRDDIIASLDRNEYNHITATYFLLAERKLRMQRIQKSDLIRGHNQVKKNNINSNNDEKDGAAAASTSEELSAMASPPLPPIQMSSSIPPPPSRPTLPTKRISLPPLSSPIVDSLFSPSEAAASFRRKCTIVEEEEEASDEDFDTKTPAVCDDSGVIQRTSSRSSLAGSEVSSSSNATQNLDLAFVQGMQASFSKPLMTNSEAEATPAPFPVASQIGTGLSRQGSLRRSETSGSNSGGGSPCTTPPGSTPSSSQQGSPARYKLAGTRKLAATRSSPQLMLNQIHEEAEDGGGHIDPVDNFPQTKAGAVVIRRLEQRRRLKLHKARTTSCSSSDASDDEAAASEVSRRPPRPEKTPTPPPPLGRDPHDDSSDSNQDLAGNSNPPTVTSGGHSRTTTTTKASTQDDSNTSHGKQQTGAKNNSNTSNKSAATDDMGGRVLTSRRNRHLNSSPAASRVRQSRSLNRISELHVVADFNGHEDMLSRYLDSVSRGQTRSRDDSLTSSDGEFDGNSPQQQPATSQHQPRRSKVNLRVLEQRLNKIQEECNHSNNTKIEDLALAGNSNSMMAAEDDGDISDNVSTVTDDLNSAGNGIGGGGGGFYQHPPFMTKTIVIEDKENNFTSSETTSVKSCHVGFNHVSSSNSTTNSTKTKSQPHLHRAHSCGSLFSLKERALLRKKLSSHVTAAFWDILSHSAATAVAASEVEVAGVVTGKSSVVVNPPDLSLALNSNPLAMFQSTSRCCNLC